METYKHLQLQIEDHVAVITLDNPPVNALSHLMLAEIRNCFETLAKDKTIYACIITGNGKAFVAGADLKVDENAPVYTGDQASRLGQVAFEAIEAAPFPVIAAINGYAFGGGLELTLACDIRLMSDKATIGMTESTLGLSSTYGGLTRLPWIIGEENAKWMFFTGERIGAAQAKDFGLVFAVIPHDELMENAMALAKKIASNAPISIRLAKKTINKYREDAFYQGFLRECYVNYELSQSKDMAEGIAAFMERRPAKFINE